jgi:ketosteroid isomerase-like protein
MKQAIADTKVDVKPYFKALKPYLIEEKCDILQCNLDFFQAIANRDIDTLRALWTESDEAITLRSRGADGYRLCTGYVNVIQSWIGYFQNQQKSIGVIEISDVHLHYFGDVAIVTCRSEEKSPVGGALKSHKYFVMNTFLRSADTKRHELCSHVSSLAPIDEFHPANTRMRETYVDPVRGKAAGSKSKRGAGGMMQQVFGGAMGVSGPAFGNDESDDGEEEEESDGTEMSGLDENEPLQNRLRNTVRQAVTRIVQGAQGSGVATSIMMIGPNGEEFIDGGGSGSEGSSDEDDDYDEEQGKILAARTLAAVKWLHTMGRITTAEKRVLTSDIVRNVGVGKFSRAEVAYSVLVGDGRPGEWDSEVAIDLAQADEEDMMEFAEACRALVKRMGLS